jgi:hypothetical protein
MKKHLASIGLGSVAGVALFIILIWLVRLPTPKPPPTRKSDREGG